MSTIRPSGFEDIRDVLAAADEPLTASQILGRLRERGVDAFDSSYRVATVLGQAADRGEPIEVVEGSPYRYRLAE
ncbi:helix-turn-helix domain-containing protein [Halobellus clavatus]|jgi:hypothetical protein|uniref:HTH HARE-type domain-containing protein n=1 Tax=Halobellus clavatus TaxID=660517 RepID=A0A1H3JLV4_9EURY|nr:hypothetical protein [Halobellus clavatus]SDY40569.1 hypothetical protein SAMN04487946_11437 [Halobellus clavatus]